MPNFSYLLRYFQAGDKILLYARGKNGRDIYEFLKTQPQFQIFGFVDRNADRLTDVEVPVFRPDQLKTISPEAFDKIVITVMSQVMGAEVCQIIRDSGVDEKKIVAPYTYLGPVTGVAAEDFISNPPVVQQEIGEFISRRFGNLLYFEPLVQALKLKKADWEALLPSFWETSRRLSPLENIVFLHILYLADIFDAALMKRLLECILEIDQPELRQFLQGLFNDTSTMCFLHAEYLFPEFYNLRRNFLKKLCGMYDFHMQTDKIRKRADGKIRKICILNHMLFGEKASPTQVSIQTGRILAGLGYEVMVMPLDVYTYIPVDTPVFRPVINVAYSGSKEFEDFHKEAYGPAIQVEYTDIVDLQEKMQAQLDKLAAFSPDLIVDMSDDFSILSYIYSQHFTTLFLPMRGYQSCSFFTYFAAIEWNVFIKINSVYHSIDPKQALELSTCVCAPEPQAVYSRENYSLANDDFVAVTVGGRLNTEMSKDFIDVVCSTLNRCPDMKWLVVGSESEYLSENYQNLLNEHKIRYILYENDLPALYQICSVYLNPQRQGGGTSICWAMHYIPIAMARTASDQAAVIGLENMIDGTAEQVMAYVLEMKRNPIFYAGERDKFRKRVLSFERCQNQAWKNMIDTLERRIKGKSSPKISIE